MNSKKLLLNSLPLVIIGTVMVYAAAPSGGYLPGATTDPDCSVGDTGCFVTLPTDQDNQNLTLSGTNLSIEDGNSVTLPSITDTDDQTLTLSGSDLSITDGNSVSLSNISILWSKITGIPSDITDGDDDTQLTETQVDSFVSNNGYLTGYTDTDTDDQTLTLSGSNLSIADGNSVTLPSFTDTNTQLTETQVDNFVSDNGYLTGYTDTDTDDQTLTLSGTNLSIEDGNSVSLSGISGSNIWTQTGSTTYYNSGNVGVGTTSPQAKLDVNGETKSLAYKSMNDGTLTSVAYKIGNDNDNGLYRPANNTIGFVTTANERMRITSAGNVGIGTTAPAESLHILNGNQVIESSTSAYTRYMDNGATPRNFYSGINFDAAPNVYSIGNKDTDTSFVTVDLNGNVGIGTTTPTYKFQVSGANSDASINGVRVGKGGGDVGTNTAVGNGTLNSNTTGVHNTANGYLVLNNNTTGHSNTAMGYTALRYNTTGVRNAAYGYAALASNTTGYYNTANGYQSLYLNTTGNNNTSTGYASLLNNTTGYLNTANGTLALRDNTTGNYNVANGSSALRNNTTGTHNTANGVSVLQSNTTGYLNAANGYIALGNNTTGNNNTANGAYALHNNTTGNNNTANGYGALSANIIGHSNVANGYSSLGQNTTGHNNVTNGAYALYGNTTGIFNTALGNAAGDNLTTGDNNIIIGANTDAPSATADNQLNIGNWIYGDDGDIGIGTSTPLAALHVTTGAIAASSSNYPSFFIKNDGKTDGVLGKTWGMMNYGGGLYFNGYGSDSSNLAPGAPVNALFLEDQTGNVGIGTSTPAQKLDVNGNIAVSGTTVHTSDGRLKTNIEDIDNALERILTIKGVSYNWKKETNNTPDRQIGVIAQDVEVEFSELVLENGEYKSVNYSGLIGPIIEAIRELFFQIMGVQDDIEKLQQENVELKAEIQKIKQMLQTDSK